MSLDKTYKKVPGTTIFDAEQSAKGYHLNQFCMSLMKPANRERYLADERAYLDEWPLTDAQQAGPARPGPQRRDRGGRQHLLPREVGRHPRPVASSRWPAR